MSQINRKYNFQDETRAIANQLDEELDQLVESYNAQDLMVSNHISQIVDPSSNDATRDKHVSDLDIKSINDQIHNVSSGGLDLRYYTKPEIDEVTGQLNTLNTNDKSNLVNAINEVNSLNTAATYVLDLSKWVVKNDGTDAINTTKGINDAMAWAVQNGYTEIVLPKGTYLIDENSPIEPQSNLTLNLNGSTLKIRTNSNSDYSVIKFQRNQVYSRITNGKIIGDRNAHDYSSGTTHEGGYGIQIGSFTPTANGGSNAKYITLDNLEIYDFTGDSIALCSTFGQISPFPTALASSWEQGDIDPSNGNLIASTSKIRSTLNISMTQPLIVKYGYFGLYGNGFGSLGSDITCDYYNVIFYKVDHSFISSKTLVQFFDEIEVPLDASYAKVVLHQSTVPASANCLINVRVPTFPQHVQVKKCDLHHSRRLGISVNGAKNIYIESNAIHHIGGNGTVLGTDPQGGIDIEDGYDLNQFIHIHKNNFHDNEKYNIIVVNGKCIYITNNTLLKLNNQAYVSLAINGGVDRAIVTGNTIRHGKVVISGECQFNNNHVYGTQVNAASVYATKPINIADSTFYNCKFVLDTPFAFLISIDNCRFVNDADKLNSLSGSLNWSIEYKNQPQKFSNCIFEGKDVQYFSYIPNNTTKQHWMFENCLFKGIPIPMMGRLVNCVGDGALLGTNYSSSTGLTTDVLELYNCKFISSDSNNILLTINNLKSFRMEQCYIEKTSGWVLKIQNVGSDVVVKNNTIKVVNDTLPRSIVTLDSSFTGSQISLTNNFIYSTNNPQVGIDNQTTNRPQIVIADNIFKKTTLKINGSEVMKNNIIDGAIDPYYKVTTEPNALYYTKGQVLYNSNPTSGGYVGWICTTAGTANKTAWAPATSYPLNALVNANSKVYKCIVAGTSGAIAPSHTTGTALDGTVTWQYVDVLAVFKQFGAII
ncbi:right-handed parallel beta-helix repeat-containing protein [Gottfriedia solisilvae]|uniref:right-handed parallel beta-helix repeat-containing protein n=1 Tax=Gottfriedia solisilvae TaxID=1516104 RepID=UPI003D2F4874